MVHVLTGPDHLCALATLSAVSDICTSFFLGIRWGVGHSTGLLAVGIFLISRDYIQQAGGNGSNTIEMPEKLSHFFDSIVGVVMLCLGLHGLRQAYRHRLDSKNYNAMAAGEEKCLLCEDSTSGYTEFSHDDEVGNESSNYLPNPESDMEDPHRHIGCLPKDQCIGHCTQHFSSPTLAFLAGIVHGLTGPGGVLGVIPAVQLHDWKLASVYLSSFCISSTLTMGCFASLYGLCTSSVGKKGNIEFQVHCFSSILSILVGITWLVLLSLGKLDDIFP